MSAAWDKEQIEAFLYYESRLLDDHQYTEWESLWEDTDTLYWIPAGGEDMNPDREISYVYDNRQRLSTRIKQLLTGEHYSQVPESRTQHFISNIEVMSHEKEVVQVRASLLVVECRLGDMHFWPAKVFYKLRRRGDGLKLLEKKVMLVNREQPITSMAFIL